ncbi:bromodomain adjacent to zinc finger domain protein 1A-like [Uranotaenia lowii]|uniref:bromodomain adjacent to zinc finger domain protein 1A-like n=1 Tax=Uranotaenia lowii TaxID=190385 RepID=UPI002478A7D4|nr:bromodomain adjacent to zinc finger domain protein 1A-like [Uranotaenia lowii]
MPSSSEDEFNTTDLDNTFSCRACDRSDAADNLVACDKCSDWLHYSCAGVGPEVKTQPWTCSKCREPPPKTVSHRTSSSVRKAKLELDLQRLEEEKKLEQRFLEKRFRRLEESILDGEDGNVSVKSRPEVPVIEKQKRTAEWVIQTGSELEGAVGGANLPDPENAKSTLVENPIPNLQQLLQACQGSEKPTLSQLKELQEMLLQCQLEQEPEKARRNKQPADSQRINTQFGNVRASNLNRPEVQRPLSKPPLEAPMSQRVAAKGAVPKNISRSKKSADRSQVQLPCIPEISSEQPVIINNEPNHTSSEIAQVPENARANEVLNYEIPRLAPSQKQLAARQMLPRDLPEFSGNPVDWPVFISHYNYTSEACGFNDGENMIRLQRCLKGSAWEAVRSRLILPASVGHVIETLRMRFGRPELLIESLIERVKATPAPKVDKLDTVIEFGTKVQAPHRSCCPNRPFSETDIAERFSQQASRRIQNEVGELS